MAGNGTIYLKHEKAKALVLCIHGFLGSPCQFDFLAEALFARGCDVQTVWLPGHGSTGEDFALCKKGAWQVFVNRQLKRAAERYEKIWLIGHSMGAWLALEAGLTFPQRVAGAVSLAAPMGMRLCPRSMVNGLGVVCQGEKSRHPRVQCYTRGFGVGKTRLRTYPLWLKQVRQLQSVIRRGRENAPRVHFPVLVIASEKDESIRRKSGQQLFDRLLHAPRRLVVLQKFWHAWFPQEEAQRLREEICAFIESGGTEKI